MIATYQKTSTAIEGLAASKVWTKLANLLLALAVTVSTGLAAANPVLAPNYPERYAVVEGDTLWDISSKFLRDPWRWPEIWQGNPQVVNPDLIYPGDVLIMAIVDGTPTLRSLRRETIKLSPSARSTGYLETIAPIDPRAIQAYISAPLVTDEKELLSAGYIVEGVDSRLLMGKYDQFYARGIEDQQADEYRVFRPGRHFVDPVSEESLGWEAEHVGVARMLQTGDPARLTLLKTFSDVSIRDRLRPVNKKGSLPFFYPKAPDNPSVRGLILDTKNRTTELGALSVVALNLGQRESVQAGDVFRILSQQAQKQDPVSGEKYHLPEEKIGLLIVFRTFEKVSYALITNSTRGIKPNDVVVSPDQD